MVEDTRTTEEWLKEKIIDWQNGESKGLGTMEKGTCVALLFNKLNDLTKEVEDLKAKIGGDL